MTHAQIQIALKAIGTEIGSYHQQTRINSVPKIKNAMPDGFCGGASLAWVQGILTGRSASEGPGDYEAAASFLATTPTAKNRFFLKQDSLIQSALGRVRDQRDKDLDELNRKAALIVDQKLAHLPIQQRNDVMERLQVTLDNQVAAITAAAAQKKATLNGLQKADALAATFWKEFGKEMDAKLKTTNYSSLTIACVSSARQYGSPNGLLSLLQEVLCGKSLATGNAGVIGINPPPASGHSGHAVAVHRVTDQLYYFFDPNFGVYAVNARNLIGIFKFLFLEAYPSPNTPGGDSHPYEVDGKIFGDYVIYRGTSRGHASSRVAPCDLRVA